MSRRGNALHIVMIALSVGIVGAGVFGARVMVNIEGRRAVALREQTLWLARSACWSGFSGSRTVVTEQGTAEVARRGDEAQVSLGAGQATMTCSTHEERYVVVQR